MSLPDSILLTSQEEAVRLWDGAQHAWADAGDDLVSLCSALDLGIRAASVLAIDRLQLLRDRFPGTIASQLETPMPSVDPHHDAIATPKMIAFNEVLDLLSEPTLECVGPHLHRGWEDRRTSCERSRKIAAEAVGFSIDVTMRHRLLLLAAYRNRIFRYPPPVRIEAAQVRDAFPALTELMQLLE